MHSRVEKFADRSNPASVRRMKEAYGMIAVVNPVNAVRAIIKP
jgi:hypothetical protein